MRAKDFIPASKPRNFVAKNQKTGGAGAHKDKKKAEKQGDVKHKGKQFDEAVTEGSEFGAYYYEKVAQEIFDKRQDITSEDEVLNQAYHIVSNEQGQKSARYMFNYDEDFPSDVVSAYFWLQKQQGKGVAEGSEEQVYKVVALDKSNALKKPTKLNVKASSIEDVFSRLAANDWYALSINGVEVVAGKRLKQGVAEYGDTAKGQKMLAKVQKRAVDRVVSKKADTDPAYAKKNKDTADRAWERMKNEDMEEGRHGYDDAGFSLAPGHDEGEPVYNPRYDRTGQYDRKAKYSQDYNYNTGKPLGAPSEKKGFIFYNVADPQTAEKLGLKQTKSGKWYLPTGSTFLQKQADKVFGKGRIWYPKD